MVFDTSGLTQLFLKALRKAMQSAVFRKIIKAVVPVLAIAPFIFAITNWAGFEDIGTVNLFRAIQLGLPWWLAFIPFLSLVTFLILVLPPFFRGKYSLTALPAIFIPILLIASAWKAPRSMDSFLGMGISLFVSCFYTMFALMLDYFEPLVPLEHPFARFSYLGRYKHLIALQTMSRRWNWKFHGPSQKDQEVVVHGTWKNRPFFIQSSNLEDPPQMLLRVGMYSTQMIPSMLIVGGSIPVVGKYREMATLGRIRNSRGLSIPIFLPNNDYQVPASYFEPLQRILENRRGLIDLRSTVEALANSITYEQTRSLSMSAGEETLCSILDLLNELCSLLERIPSVAVEEMPW